MRSILFDILVVLVTVKFLLVFDDWAISLVFLCVIAGYYLFPYLEIKPSHTRELEGILTDLKNKVPDTLQRDLDTLREDVNQALQTAKESRDLSGRLSLAAGLKVIKKENN